MKHRDIVRAAITVIASLTLALQAHAEVHSKSNELIVVLPADLPEQAQIPGNSFFLYSDNSGSTYLYVEQQQGARLTASDVTDPSSSCLAVKA
jgi:hypothetical protein